MPLISVKRTLEEVVVARNISATPPLLTSLPSTVCDQKLFDFSSNSPDASTAGLPKKST